LLSYHDEASKTFDIVIQLGAILAVLVLVLAVGSSMC